MAEISSRPARLSAPLGPMRGACLLLLALALAAGHGGPSAPAHAAPPAQETITNLRFYLNVDQPSQYCAGQKYPIRVTPLAELSGVRADGRRFTDSDRLVTGVLVTAEIQDTGIATIRPPDQRSGALEIHRNSSVTQHPGMGALTFTLHAAKAGTTNLYLTARAPARFASGAPQYFGPRGMPAGFPITVINCEYDVTVTYDWALSGTGFRYWSIGTLRARIKASDQEFYGGDGLFDFFLNHYDLTCSERLTYQNPTHVSARHDFTDDTLRVTFSMTAGPASPSCPNSYLLSNAPLSDPASPWGGVPVSLSAAGETKRIQLVTNAPGRSRPTGWATITIQPVATGGGR